MTKTENKRKNILLIITDQQRADCMSGVGHPVIATPNLDHLAARGVLFSNSYIQASPCGPSRMCLYTGRYMHAHRSTFNQVPLPNDERTIGTYFSQAGYRVAWAGKSHLYKDYYPSPAPADASIGFHEVLPDGAEDWGFRDQPSKYLAYLLEKGYPQWVGDFADGQWGGGVRTPDGDVLDVREYRASEYPTVVSAEDSCTAWHANRALDFIEQASADDRPWLLALNWISPHHPWVAPAPYHQQYDPAEVPPPNRHPDELRDPHPLHKLLRVERRSVPLDDEQYCRVARAVYYGMISEIDHHVGRLVDFLSEKGLTENTIVVFTSDHGEYIGDHWLIEKEFWYEAGARVPLIVVDPSPEADGTRGHVQEAFVAQIDIVPTLLDAVGQEVANEIQGRSFMPMIRDRAVPADWRTQVHADWDFRFYWSARELGLRPEQCRAWMIRDRQFNYVYFNGLPDVLYDLQKDPRELHNVAAEPKYRDLVERYRRKLMDWRMSMEDNSRINLTFQQRPKLGNNPFSFRFR